MATDRATRTGLKSRVGRRLFGVFVVSALVPMVALAAISYVQVSAELRDQSSRRLHAAARATGQEMARRLLTLERRLASGDPAPEGFLAVGRGEEPGLETVPGLARDSRRRLWVTSEGVLLAAVGPGGRRVGRADPESLLALSHENVLPPGAEFVIATEGRVVASSLPDGFAPHPAWLDPRRYDDLLTWEHAGEPYLVRQWSLFLDASLGAPSWNVVLLEPRAQALAPLGVFRLAFLAATAVGVLVVPLLALGQIRRSLVPLERLRLAAARIGARDFSARVRVESIDEFGEVGRSFNQMAGALSDHFEALDQMLNVDREILEAADEAAIVAALIRNVPTLCGCESARFLPIAATDTPADGELSPSAFDELRLIPGVPTQLCDPVPAPLREQEWARPEGSWLLSLVSAASPIGVLALEGVGEGDDRSRLPYACQLADQAAAALGHLRERERRRVAASYDAETKLSNLRSFEERLDHAMGSGAGDLSIWVAKLDGVARLSRSYGRERGAEAVRHVARRIHAVGGGAEVFRIAEDLLAGITSGLDEARARAREVMREISRPIDVAGSHDVRMRGFAGVAEAAASGAHAVELIRSARAAAEEACETGHVGVRVPTREGDVRARRRLELEADLHRALERDELELEYQPIVDADSGDLVAAEALMRWRRPGGVIRPDVFIPIAEETGLVVDLGRWALREAAGRLSGWIGEGLTPIQMHVNVSSPQLDGGAALQDLVRDALLASGLPARWLVLELTESILTQPTGQNVETMEAVARLGAQLAIDDFGTGYASLAYLQKFPFSSLKIDQEFVRDLPENPGNAEIVRAVLGMAEGLGIRVVAEGVETEAARVFLRDAGCHELQGYLFSRPLPVDAFRKLFGEYDARGAVVE